MGNIEGRDDLHIQKLTDGLEEFVTLIESGKGMDIGIIFLPREWCVMEKLFNRMLQGTVNDVVVSGYSDAETPPVFHPMYAERIYFIISDDIFELYIEDGVIRYYQLENINEWFDVDVDDKFSLMSISTVI
jgi:hypothetical protein